MGKKKFAKAPLLYIEQPTVNNPEAEMQHQYKSKRRRSKPSEKAVDTEEDTVTYNSIRQPAVEETVQDKEAHTEEETEEAKEEEDIKSESKKRKNFRDMSIEEKVMYFVESSSYAPKVRCEVRTANRKYRGKIVDFKDNLVYIETGSRSPNRSVSFDKITDIQIIGF